MKIYTKFGDNQKTQIKNNVVFKNNINVEVEGCFDEAMASMMVAASFCDGKIKEELKKICKKLFVVASDVAGYSFGAITTSDVLYIESSIDELNQYLDPLHDFILPGNNIKSSHIHLCRTIVRRLERRIVELSLDKEVNQEVLRYINRLSDYLFVMARYVEK